MLILNDNPSSSFLLLSHYFFIMTKFQSLSYKASTNMISDSADEGSPSSVPAHKTRLEVYYNTQDKLDSLQSNLKSLVRDEERDVRIAAIRGGVKRTLSQAQEQKGGMDSTLRRRIPGTQGQKRSPFSVTFVPTFERRGLTRIHKRKDDSLPLESSVQTSFPASGTFRGLELTIRRVLLTSE